MMNFEQQRVRRILTRNTLLFFATFAVLFSLFGVLVFQLVSNNVYRSADEQLASVHEVAAASTAPLAISAESTTQQNEALDAAVALPSVSVDTSASDAVALAPLYDIGEQYVESNPQIIYLLRDATGSVASTEGLYATYPSYFNDAFFDASNLNSVYEVSVGGHTYRGINYKLDAPEGEAQGEAPLYLQALANIDSEIALLDHFTKTLVLYLMIAVVVSAAVSYLLSRKTIKPIVASLNQQMQFVQNASHELRTPLAIIRGTQERLLSAPASRVVDKFEEVSTAVDETKRLARLVDDLTVLTSADISDTQEKVTEPADVCKVMKEVAERYADLVEVEKKTLVSCLQPTGKASIHDDALQQVLGILLENALKYTQPGDTIELRCDQHGGRVRVSVVDTGCGIAPEDRLRVFERFYRGDAARTTPGSGLGLSIAHALVKRAGGTIEIKENFPCGTLAVVVLRCTVI